jgi:hypothetical protein
LLEARKALSSLQVELLPPELISRIFARDDLDYVTSSTSDDVRVMFLAERERIARSWIKQLRRQIVSLREFHLGSARHYAQLKFRTELALAGEFAILMFACGALDLAVRIRGPYGAQRILDTTTAAAARVCEISEKSLGFLRPGGVSSMRNPPARNGAVL